VTGQWDEIDEIIYPAYNVEVAVGFTDHTWVAALTTVEDFPLAAVRKVAEDKVLEDYSSHPTKAVSFVKAIWVGEEPTEEDMVEVDEEEIT
jgi:hypothetical protein